MCKVGFQVKFCGICRREGDPFSTVKFCPKHHTDGVCRDIGVDDEFPQRILRSSPCSSCRHKRVKLDRTFPYPPLKIPSLDRIRSKRHTESPSFLKDTQRNTHHAQHREHAQPQPNLTQHQQSHEDINPFSVKSGIHQPHDLREIVSAYRPSPIRSTVATDGSRKGPPTIDSRSDARFTKGSQVDAAAGIHGFTKCTETRARHLSDFMRSIPRSDIYNSAASPRTLANKREKDRFVEERREKYRPLQKRSAPVASNAPFEPVLNKLPTPIATRSRAIDPEAVRDILDLGSVENSDIDTDAFPSGHSRIKRDITRRNNVPNPACRKRSNDNPPKVESPTSQSASILQEAASAPGPVSRKCTRTGRSQHVRFNSHPRQESVRAVTPVSVDQSAKSSTAIPSTADIMTFFTTNSPPSDVRTSPRFLLEFPEMLKRNTRSRRTRDHARKDSSRPIKSRWDIRNTNTAKSKVKRSILTRSAAMKKAARYYARKKATTSSRVQPSRISPRDIIKLQQLAQRCTKGRTTKDLLNKGPFNSERDTTEGRRSCESSTKPVDLYRRRKQPMPQPLMTSIEIDPNPIGGNEFDLATEESDVISEMVPVMENSDGELVPDLEGDSVSPVTSSASDSDSGSEWLSTYSSSDSETDF